MERFLKVIAEGYKGRYEDISRLTFILPNRRSGSFLLKYFKELSNKPEISPRILSISDFIALVSPKVQDSRLDLIFRLYTSYLSLKGSIHDLEFEKFISWGETLLSDFNEIDMHMVNVEEIFENITDINLIRSNFLTEEQKAVRQEYFRYAPVESDSPAESFWKKFIDVDQIDRERIADGKEPAAKKKFLTLWQLLLPLYEKFKSSLFESGLTTTGGAYRELAEAVEKGFEPLPGEKIIFAGFNALSESERRIFKALKQMKVEVGHGEESKADFIWDLASSVFTQEDDPASRFVRINSRADNFPAPDWLEPGLERTMPVDVPRIEVIAVPSNIMQAKVAGAELVKIAHQVSSEEIENARIAVILPDENLLLPLLYSLPDEYPNPNLTMGFPLRHTPVISFAALLKKLHRKSRKSGENAWFFFEDVKDLLSHPYSQVLFLSEDIRKFIDKCEERKTIMVNESLLHTLGGCSEEVFQFLGDSCDPVFIIEYISRILVNIRKALEERGGLFLRSQVERIYIDTYYDALWRLANCIGEYDINLGVSGVFMLADKLISGETVAFEGDPIGGLQVMGVLETRCLDFDRIIMLSVNEKIMPRVGRNSTFIPNSLRVAYGMPPANYQEEIFAYYFFRILSRCTSATITYDSRSSDVRAVGPSRYLLQMKYLPGKLNIIERTTGFMMPAFEKKVLKIEKNGEIDKILDRYLLGTPSDEESCKVKNFSASSLDHYTNCALKFLFGDILRLPVEKEKTETITPIDMGTIVHSVIEHLYVPDGNKRRKFLESPILITRDFLKSLLKRRDAAGNPLIESEAKRNILLTHFHIKEEHLEKETLRGSAAILLEYVVAFVKNIIESDMRIAPFLLWGCEIEETVDYRLNDGRSVRVKMVVDRLDQLIDENGPGPFRIVDYKTGEVNSSARTFDEVFNGSWKAKNILQPILYAELFLKCIRDGLIKLPPSVSMDDLADNLQIVLYAVPKLPDDEGMKIPEIGEVKIDSIQVLRKYEKEQGVNFMERIEGLISEILDKTVPFEGEPQSDNCRMCDYQLQCELLSATENE